MEHIEEAAFILVIPLFIASTAFVCRDSGQAKQQTRDLAFALNVVGLMNIQFAIARIKSICWK